MLITITFQLINTPNFQLQATEILIATWHLKGEDLVWADPGHPTSTTIVNSLLCQVWQKCAHHFNANRSLGAILAIVTKRTRTKNATMRVHSLSFNNQSKSKTFDLLISFFTLQCINSGSMCQFPERKRWTPIPIHLQTWTLRVLIRW